MPLAVAAVREDGVVGRACVKILALETATEFCSLALLIDGELVERSEFAPRRHAELLLPMCDAVLAEAGIARSQLDAIAVGQGPGAFTGVRLAVSAAQGLALGLDRPVVPVSSLAALAMAAPRNAATQVLSLIDARMGEIYAGLFRRDVDGLVSAVGDESVTTADTLALPTGELNIVGSGWETYRQVLAQRLAQPPVHADGQCFPQASAVARLAYARLQAGAGIDAAQAQPSYLRDKVALTLAEQAKARS